MYGNYYAPFQRPMGYYNPSIPTGQEAPNYPTVQQYQPQATQPNAPPSFAPQNSSDMIWVLNDTEAMAYPVAPNTSVTLWDKSKDTVYIKANMQGVPSMRILDYTERTNDGVKMPFDGSKFASAEDFKALRSKFNGLQDELNELKAKAKVKATKKEVSDDE